MTPFRWLHLTDLHLGMQGQSPLWPNVEDMFVNDLKLLHERVGAWDMVLFTGDLTQRGSEAEFDEVEKFLQKLWGQFKQWGFTPQLLAIPGNHDLVRPADATDPALISLLHTWHLPAVQTPFWDKADSPQRRLVAKAFQPFTDWWANTAIPKPTTFHLGLLPGDCATTVEVADGLKIGIVGLNTAYLQLAEGDFQGKLWLDVRQLHEVCNRNAGDWTKQHDACLLLTHHPVQWLSTEAQTHFADEIHYPPERFVLHLFGHMHEGDLISVARGGGNERRAQQACSLFGMETWGKHKGQRKHGYTLCQLELAETKLSFRSWPREATKIIGGGRRLQRDSSFTLEESSGGTKPIVVKRLLTREAVRLCDTVTAQPSFERAASYDPRLPPFYVPYHQKGNQVVGRDTELAKVRQQLVAGRRTAIGQTALFQGLGGLGKTQLAVEYAYNYRQNYPNGVIWITADQDIDAQLVDLAVKARWVAPESEHSVKLALALRRLRSYSECLIVFDNLEQMDAIQRYLPEHPANPHILVTSRTEQPDFTYVPIDVLDSGQSLQLLLQEAGRQPDTVADREAAQAIANTLGGLPLALELAGAYLARRPVGWQDYLVLLQHNLRAALPQRFASLTRHQADLYSTLQISEGVFAEELRLREVLDVLTWSAAAPMGLDLLAAMMGIQKPTELTGALGLGVALRILQKTPGTQAYGIHRLVREVRREDVPLASRGSWAVELCHRIGDWFEALRKDFVQLSRFEAEFDHLVEWHRHAGVVAPQQASRFSWLQAYPAFHRGQPQEIRRRIELALDEYQQHSTADRSLLSHLYADLAYAFASDGNPRRALELAEQALGIRLELFGEHHVDTAASLNNIASYHQALGNPKRALELTEQALDIRRELLGERHPDTATSLGNLASYYHDLGNPKRALELTEQALDIRRELLGERHPDTATSLGNVASSYHVLGNPKRALELAEQALEIRSELLGERHPDTAISLSNIASLHKTLGNPMRSLELAEQALDIRRKLFGERHPETALSLNNIASYYHDLGNPKRALELAEQALDIRRELLGERHPDTANALHNIAAYLLRLRRPQAAHARATEALEILRYVFGEKHPATLTTFTLLRQIASQLPGFRVPPKRSSGTGKKKRR
jgi:tetratricopeptide (TPR) repeat protein